ncbi:MAG: hypothetical protein QOE58_3266, partial [Actinomycetota bacterium]|nr:hypothetical protein [Actinomycetota bacterium]MDQ1538873.1 hypothetical protein [Actinomycetota bacterium]
MSDKLLQAFALVREAFEDALAGSE